MNANYLVIDLVRSTYCRVVIVNDDAAQSKLLGGKCGRELLHHYCDVIQLQRRFMRFLEYQKRRNLLPNSESHFLSPVMIAELLTTSQPVDIEVVSEGGVLVEESPAVQMTREESIFHLSQICYVYSELGGINEIIEVD